MIGATLGGPQRIGDTLGAPLAEPQTEQEVTFLELLRQFVDDADVDAERRAIGYPQHHLVVVAEREPLRTFS